MHFTQIHINIHEVCKNFTQTHINMRDFHNKYVKRKLIKAVSKRGDTLIDFAVGKGGDMPKWIDAKLDFIFGVDISPDNIDNVMDGAYARYLFQKREPSE